MRNLTTHSQAADAATAPSADPTDCAALLARKAVLAKHVLLVLGLLLVLATIAVSPFKGGDVTGAIATADPSLVPTPNERLQDLTVYDLWGQPL
jgi:hypothetical protein